LSKLPAITPRELEKVLLVLGFVLIRQKGSHRIYKHFDGRRTVIPFHQNEDIGKGLLRTILNEIEVSRSDFVKLRNKHK